MCALALVRESLDPDIDLVILASQDSDLVPALDEAIAFGSAKIETFAWFEPKRRHKSPEIRPERHRIWNTRMGESEFLRCFDLTLYR